jgi:hypothetical protein
MDFNISFKNELFAILRILGFFRVPPLIGRVVDITQDIRERATHELAKTFFISPGKLK